MSANVNFKKNLQGAWDNIEQSIKHQMVSRAYRGANELRNATQLVLRGRRSGRKYIVPGTGRVTYYKRSKTAKITYKRYTASAPGEPPAVRTGAFRMSWKPRVYIDHTAGYAVVSQVESTQRTDNGRYLLGEILEEGTPGGKIAPRPHHDKIKAKATPAILKIFDEPYF